MGLVDLLRRGYTRYVGHASNEIIKVILRKQHLLEAESEHSVEDMVDLESGVQPFKGQAITQTLFLFDVEKSIEKLRRIVVQPKL